MACTQFFSQTQGCPSQHAAKCAPAIAQYACLSPKVVRGVLYTGEESEGKRQRNPFDTITEGLGQNRLTANFARAQVDGSVKCSDQEAIDMVRCYTQGSLGTTGLNMPATRCAGDSALAQRMLCYVGGYVAQ